MQANIAVQQKFDRSIVVDCTHMGRRASGIERITRELFSEKALWPLKTRMTPEISGRISLIFNQMVVNPWHAAMHPHDVWIFPGYPPSPLFLALPCPKVLYVHDLFLMTQWEYLNWPARLYNVLPFKLAVRHFRFFFVNSLTTRSELAAVVRPDAQIIPFRPVVRDVLGLAPRVGATELSRNEKFVIGALGLVVPRKNFIAAAEITYALGQKLNRIVELHIIGRPGWGRDHERLRLMPHVRLHGFIPDAEIPQYVAKWDAFLCTSHDEGLGLPLLEIQHAGLPVIAPDRPIFREVLGDSGTFIHPDRPEEAAALIADLLTTPDWRSRAAALARSNIAKWNSVAEQDQRNAIGFLSALCRGQSHEHQSDDPRR